MKKASQKAQRSSGIKKAPKKNTSMINPWLAFAGAIIIGSGIGLATDNAAVWSTIGVGVGFLLVLWLKAKYGSRTED